jgi:putative ABC transport system permease protein
MNHQPPSLARKIFEWLAGDANVDDLLGDLEERFAERVFSGSLRRAKYQYWRDVLSLSFSYALRKRKRDVKARTNSSSAITSDMLLNYFKVAMRNLAHYKYFSTLNVIGLAIGMSVSLLLISIYSYVSTYDDFHENKDRIYTVISHHRDGVEEATYASAPLRLADRLEREFAGADQIVRIVKPGQLEIDIRSEAVPVKAYYVESHFFAAFSFELFQGSPAVLDTPMQLVLTESAAMKLFNSLDVVGKVVALTDGQLFQVGALMRDHPRNSHLNFEILMSFPSLPARNVSEEDQWTDFAREYVYVLLRENAEPEDLQTYLAGIAASTYSSLPVKVNFSLNPLRNVAMGPDLRGAIGVAWEKSGFFLFGVFALMILLPACFNYTNLSIARALKRSKEIGLRKTMGGVQTQLFYQFLMESTVIALLALAGGLLIFLAIRHEFQSMMVAGSSLDLSLTPGVLAWFIVFAMGTGIVAGVFPAFHFARLNPIAALKNKISSRGTSLTVRKGLTIFQFMLSFGFILSLVVFNRQYQYSRNFDFGFHKENILDVRLNDVDPELFRTAFSQLASVESMSMSSGLLGVTSSRTWIHPPDNDSIEVAQMFADPRFIGNFGLTLVAGKNFPDEGWEEERYLIVNEEFVKAQRIEDPRDALGLTWRVGDRDLEVIGVLKNFHFEPLTVPIDQFVLRFNPAAFAVANLRVHSLDAAGMIDEMERVWKRLPTETKFKARFFEDELDDAYQTYRVLLKIVGFLGVLAISVSLLGMLGMVVYTSETKTKEVSIRKVMGASVGGIALLLSKDYLRMMAFAIVAAIPITGLLLNSLLPHVQHYRVQLSVWDVIASAAILLALGLLTIASQTYKTAVTNPADTLRRE